MCIPTLRDPEFRKYAQQQRRLIKNYEQLLKGGIAEGALTDVDPVRATATMLAMVESPLRRPSRRGRSSAAETAAFVADFAVRALLIDRTRLKEIKRVEA